MIRAKFGQFWRGNYYEKGEVMPANEWQAEELVKCGRAYLDVTTPETKKQIMERLDALGIAYDKSMTKAELIECLPED